MAEVMILLVFCLLIALAAFLKVEHTKRVDVEEKLKKALETSSTLRDFSDSIKNDSRLIEILKSRPAASDAAKLDEFWRELVEGRSVIALAQKNGLTSGDLRSHMGDLKAMKDKGIDLKTIERNANITDSVDKTIVPAGSATPEQVARLIAIALLKPKSPPIKPATPANKWPPIIALNDASGRFFKSGSAEVDPDFQKVLTDRTAPRIAELAKEYDVDVIEVVGHTDEQPVGKRQSNLDSDLVSVLNNKVSIASIRPTDNAGLGLARAVSVVGILRQTPELSRYKLLPLSGGQLINTDETLALGGNPGDIRERRRIEIRLRKAAARDPEPQQQSVLAPTPLMFPAPLPQARPVQPPSSIAPPSLMHVFPSIFGQSR